MKIKRITDQHRRDFTAIYVCEHCGAEQSGSGYDDDFFHRSVVPNMKCQTCDKKAGDNFRPMAPKYAAHVQI